MFFSYGVGAGSNYAVEFKASTTGANMQAYLKTKTKRADGAFDSFQAIDVPIKVKMMPHHKTGRSWTTTGYGARIPTVYMVQFHGKWRRVYAICYSNASTLFIGKRYDQTAIVEINL